MAIATAELKGKVSIAATETELSYVSVDQIAVDRSYQRELKESKVERYAAEWDDLAAGVLYVAAKGAQYYVIDGQHRWEAAKRAGIEELPCLIYYGLTKAEQARLFVVFNRERTQAHSVHVFRARLVQGDPVAKKLSVMIEGLGWQIGVGGNNTKQFAAVGTVEKLYKLLGTDKDGNPIIHGILSVLRDAWGDTGSNATIIKAIGAMVSHYGIEKLDWDGLRSALNRATLEDLVLSMQGRKRYATGQVSEPTAMAMELTDRYNAEVPRSWKVKPPTSYRVFATALVRNKHKEKAAK